MLRSILFLHTADIFAQSIFASDLSHLWKHIDSLILIKTLELNVLCLFCCPEDVPLGEILGVLKPIIFENLMQNSVVTTLQFVNEIISCWGWWSSVGKGTQWNKTWH